MKSKKAEMTTKQIVILVILIASFAVLIFFLFRLNLGDESDKQLCYNSVMNRANKLVPTDSITLNCQRGYVCITKDGSCEGMLDPIKKKVKTKEEVYEVLAIELSDCWWMFGEGKVNYVGDDMIPALYCSLCSQIKFDNSVKEIFNNNNKFDKSKLYEYMSKNKLEGSTGPTYNEYLFGTNNISLISSGQFYGDVLLDEQYYSLMGTFSEVDTLAWVGVAVAVGTAGVFFAPLLIGGTTASFAGALVIGGGAAGTGAYFLAPVLEGLSGQQYIMPSLIKVNSQEFKDLKCEEITTLS